MRQLKKAIPNLEQLRDYFRGLIPQMKVSHSSLTTRRLELWLFNEVNLGSGKVTPGFTDDKLYEFCQKLYPGSNIGLLTYHGSERGGSSGLIKSHRDHSYAMPIAVSLNLGIADFEIAGVTHRLNDGDCYEFNCKQPHAVPAIHTAERFSLVLWRLNKAKGYHCQMPINW